MVFFIGFVIAKGQTKELDSLKQELHKPNHDTTKVLVMLKIGARYYQISPDSLAYYTKQAMTLAREIDFQKGVANGYNVLGIYAYSQSDFRTAQKNYKEFLRISEETNDYPGINRALNNMGLVSKNLGDYISSLSYYERSLEIKDKIGDLEGKGGTLNNMGLLYHEIGDYSMALQCYFESLTIKEQIGKKEAFASTYSNVGAVYYENSEFEKAKEYYNKSFDLYSKYGKILAVGRSYRDLGTVYQALEQYEEAKEAFDKSLSIANEQGNRMLQANLQDEIGTFYLAQGQLKLALSHFEKGYQLYTDIGHLAGVTETLNHLGAVFLRLESYSDAFEVGQRSLEIAKELGLKKEISIASKLLYEASSANEDFENAFKFSLINKAYGDSINSDARARELALYESRQELDKVSNENTILASQNRLNQAEIEKNRLQIQRQNILIYGAILMIILSLVLTYTLYRYYKEKKNSIILLEKKNSEIVTQSKVLIEQADELIRVNEEIQQMNESLEAKVRKRTKKIRAQNKKFKEYAFSNAHLVRAPLARILGLAEYFRGDDDNISDDKKKELSQNIHASAEELDQVIRQVSEILDNKEDN